MNSHYFRKNLKTWINFITTWKIWKIMNTIFSGLKRIQIVQWFFANQTKHIFVYSAYIFWDAFLNPFVAVGVAISQLVMGRSFKGSYQVQKLFLIYFVGKFPLLLKRFSYINVELLILEVFLLSSSTWFVKHTIRNLTKKLL